MVHFDRFAPEAMELAQYQIYRIAWVFLLFKFELTHNRRAHTHTYSLVGLELIRKGNNNKRVEEAKHVFSVI